MVPGALFDGTADAVRKLVANLPYNIAAPVLLRFLDPGLRVSRLVVTVQREVAERIVALPGTAAYGRLSVAVQFRARTRIVLRIPPGAFLPPPDVESAVVEIVPRDAPAAIVPDEDEFVRIVAAGFGQRRKTLLNALAHGLGLPVPVVAAACAACGVDRPRARGNARRSTRSGRWRERCIRSRRRARRPTPAADRSARADRSASAVGPREPVRTRRPDASRVGMRRRRRPSAYDP